MQGWGLSIQYVVRSAFRDVGELSGQFKQTSGGATWQSRLLLRKRHSIPCCSGLDSDASDIAASTYRLL